MKRGKVLAFVMAILALFVFTNTASAAKVDITSAMSQDEIDEILANATAEDTITIASGDYSTTKNIKPYHKIIFVDNEGLNFVIAGEYTELQFVVRAENTDITANNATINGSASTKGNPGAALFIEEGSVNLSGNLTLNDHNHSIRLGYHKAPTTTNSSLTLMESAVLTIQNNDLTHGNNYYGNGYDDPDSSYSSPVDKGQGNGTSGAGIDIRGRGYASITLEKNANLNASNTTAAIYAIDVSNFTFDAKEGSYVNFDSNGQGFNMNTDYATSVDIKLNNSKMDITNSSSNAITGQSKPYLLDITNDSVVNLNNNGGIAINNFFVKVSDSILNANNNGSHGISNVAFDATNSTININDNAYIGLNITKYNDTKTSTDIINSTINANNNGGPGIRFFVENGVTNITDSKITTNNNGYGESLYGWTVKPGDSGYWAGVVAKGNLYAKNSVIFSNGVSGYALYDTSSGEGIFHVLENSVIVANGEESKDIFDDYNSGQGNSGNTIVTGGSLQVDSDNVSASDALNDLFHSEINPTMPSNQGEKADIQFAGPVNIDYTALTQFILHQNINKEVGGEGSHTFIYYDPNTGRVYNYTFRYNALGEDLDSTASGNAYVWAPVSIINYDATEGLINNLGTAGKVSLGCGYTDLLTGLNTRFASDITIFGNSLDLTEKILPTAIKENYVFLGWYLPEEENMELAKQYATEGNFEALYELLVIPFTQSTKALSDLADLSSGLEELTVYAKWAEVGKVIVNYVDEEGNKLADEEVITGVVGDSYETSAKEFEDYYLLRVEGYETGEIIAGTMYVTYVYVPYGIGDVEDPEEPTDEPVDEPEIIPPHTDATSANVVYPISPIVVIDNKKKYLQNI